MNLDSPLFLRQLDANTRSRAFRARVEVRPVDGEPIARGLPIAFSPGIRAHPERHSSCGTTNEKSAVRQIAVLLAQRYLTERLSSGDDNLEDGKVRKAGVHSELSTLEMQHYVEG
jgi:hypothetical protein